MRAQPCSEYVEGQKVCRSGWPVVSGTCFGIIHVGCKNCGSNTTTPPCMKDEPPANFIQENGLPRDWPIASKAQEESNGKH